MVTPSMPASCPSTYPRRGLGCVGKGSWPFISDCSSSRLFIFSAVTATRARPAVTTSRPPRSVSSSPSSSASRRDVARLNRSISAAFTGEAAGFFLLFFFFSAGSSFFTIAASAIFHLLTGLASTTGASTGTSSPGFTAVSLSSFTGVVAEGDSTDNGDGLLIGDRLFGGGGGVFAFGGVVSRTIGSPSSPYSPKSIPPLAHRSSFARAAARSASRRVRRSRSRSSRSRSAFSSAVSRSSASSSSMSTPVQKSSGAFFAPASVSSSLLRWPSSWVSAAYGSSVSPRNRASSSRYFCKPPSRPRMSSSRWRSSASARVSCSAASIAARELNSAAVRCALTRAASAIAASASSLNLRSAAANISSSETGPEALASRSFIASFAAFAAVSSTFSRQNRAPSRSNCPGYRSIREHTNVSRTSSRARTASGSDVSV